MFNSKRIEASEMEDTEDSTAPLLQETRINLDCPDVSERHLQSSSARTDLECSPTCELTNAPAGGCAEEAERKQVRRKLMMAIALCFFFMLVEVVGGVLANSLAILTDAAHLLSDVAGFAISLFALWMSSWKATPTHTFGYHRMEILGALVSMQLIWMITGILVYEAIIRMISPKQDVDGRLMFMTAAFGVGVNILMTMILGHHHSHGPGGHDHDHDHDHDHGHDHGHGGSARTNSGSSSKHSHSPDSLSHTHGSHAHSTNHPPPLETTKLLLDHAPDPSVNSSPSHLTDLEPPPQPNGAHGYTHDPADRTETASKRHGGGHGVNGHEAPGVCQDAQGNGTAGAAHAHVPESHSGSPQVLQREASAHSGHGHSQERISETSAPKENINLKGAYLHILGDLIQSIGVMIGGAIIWWKPEWQIVDLICTLLFSVLVLFTTLRMLQDIMEVLMESTPREINATELEEGIRKLEGVVDVHELHIWAITLGKVVLACHVRATPNGDTDKILHSVLEFCQREYGISHATVQVEREGVSYD